MQKTDQRYLQRCLELARKGKGWVSPNPMVGCVIVKEGRIIGEGYHKRFGSEHAETAALRAAGRNARGATLYVNLEPCSHYGKTPPCVKAIIGAGIRRVVAATRDPNPLVQGKGFRALKKSGVNVVVGILRQESEAVNEHFFRFMRTKIPFVGLKVAQTLDGKVADADGNSKWITSPQSRKEGHRIRSFYDAVLVGAGTVRKDNPELTVRAVRGRNPIRVVLDPRMSLPLTSKIFRTHNAETLLLSSANAMTAKKAKVRALSARGVKILGLVKGRRFEPAHILRILGALGISSVLVEGGPSTGSEFISAGLVNRVHWFVASTLFGGGVASFVAEPSFRLSRAIHLRDVTIRTINSDLLIEGKP